PILLGIQLLAWLIILPAVVGGHADFRQLYTAGYMVRTGHAHELYNYGAQLRFQNELVSAQSNLLPFIRPAYCALLYVPFSVLSYQRAYSTFPGVNLILLVFSHWLLSPFLNGLRGT